MEIINSTDLGAPGAPIGGSFTLHLDGYSTKPLPHTATPQEICAAVYVMESEVRRGRRHAQRRRVQRNAAAAAGVLLLAVLIVWRVRA